jgi:hypothetical protein
MQNKFFLNFFIIAQMRGNCKREFDLYFQTQFFCPAQKRSKAHSVKSEQDGKIVVYKEKMHQHRARHSCSQSMGH